MKAPQWVWIRLTPPASWVRAETSASVRRYAGWVTGTRGHDDSQPWRSAALVEQDQKVCVVCGCAIKEQKPDAIMIELSYATIICFYHPRCFQARPADECLMD